MTRRYNLISRLKEDKTHFERILTLAAPIALQFLIQALLNMVDTLMIGQLGDTAIAAVALSNQIFFLLILLLFGISSGAAVFASQFWGKRNLEGIHRVQGLTLLTGFAGALIFTIGAHFFPAFILEIFSKDKRVIAEGASYLKIVSSSYLFTACTVIYSSTLRSIGKVKLPLLLSAIALSLNTLFNYALIFGHFGLPQWGIKGAAIATTGARMVEALSLILILYLTKSPAAPTLPQLMKQNRDFTLRFIKRASPVILNEVGWSLGMTMYALIYARMGTDVIAAFNITDTSARLVFVFFQGSAFASAVVLGNMIGAGLKTEAIRCGKTILLIIPVFGFMAGLLIFLAAPLIPDFFNISPGATLMTLRFLKILGFIIFIKVSNMHIIVGLLRSGGDTHVSAALELIPLWLLSIPLCAFAGLVLHLPPHLVYLFSISETLTKYIMGLLRIRSGKWVHDLT